MRVLIIGGTGTVSTEIIQKFSKEGARVYTLSRQKSEKKGGFSRVYESYGFAYDNAYIKEVFESVNPDITIFTGAFDTSFHWENGYSETIEFGNGLYNFLNAFYVLGHGRFIYLSSDDIEDITEQKFRELAHEKKDDDDNYIKNSQLFKAYAVKKGENICGNFRNSTMSDVISLRVNNLCLLPANPSEVMGDCAKMLVEGYKKNTITIRQMGYSPLYIADMVMALYNVSCTTHLDEGLFVLQSDKIISTSAVVKMVCEALNKQCKTIENPRVTQDDFAIEAVDLSTQLKVSIFKNPKACVDETIKLFKEKPERFIVEEVKPDSFVKRIWQKFKPLILATLPFIENILLFIPFFMINNRVTGSAYFAKLDPYLLFVILAALVYGQQQAAFSAILSVAGYMFRQAYGRTGFDIMLDYNTYVWIAQLIIVGMSVGYLRDKIKLIKDDKLDESAYLGSRLKDVEDINTINVKIKDELETQVINQSESLGKIFEITSTLDSDAPEEVYFHAAEVVSQLMGCKDVAIYNVSNRSFARLMSMTSDNARKLGNSIEYTKYDDMYEELKQGRVFMNRKLLRDYPLMAVAISENNELNSIIMLWDMPLERMNLSQSNRLKVISYIIQNAVIKADRYINMLESERYIEGTRVLEPNAFRTLVNAFVAARQKHLADCSIIKVSVDDMMTLNEAGEKMAKLLRTTDYLGSLNDSHLYILLANTNSTDATYVAKRIKDLGLRYEMITRI